MEKASKFLSRSRRARCVNWREEVFSLSAIGKLMQEVTQDRVSSSGEVVQTTTGQVGTIGVGTNTQIAVVDSERCGREQAGGVVSSSLENVASATMQTSEVVRGTTVDAIAIANERFNPKFSSSEMTLVNSGIVTAVSAEDSRVNVTSIAAGERVDTRVTSELEGGVQTVITSDLPTEVNMIEVGHTENMERECTYLSDMIYKITRSLYLLLFFSFNGKGTSSDH